ncbi:MAG: HEAT repeat domain-containing protein [Nitrospira sp.]|nr:HEAT repeat domain-containing protein [Nitrospira sp.]MDH4302631.1 HEAT repeat domain-containing protein [Nitrospira sp.]MDH5195271.1 HEAT repeat domain-containing protein [Nitrospira sp.]
MSTNVTSAQEMLAAAVPARGAEDPEVASIKRVLKLLDKTAKSNRTYGSANPVAQKFSQQFFEELSTHLATYDKLSFLVQRTALLYKESVVYQEEQNGGGESMAFKLYADGIRELSLHQGLTQEDVGFFLDSLWGGLDPTNDDDDIVTRIWGKNLSTISIVTAEEVASASVGQGEFVRLDSTQSFSDSTLRDLIDREKTRSKQASEDKTTSGSEKSGSTQDRHLQAGHLGYEVTEEELTALAEEIEAERRRDSLAYILDALTAILSSEQSSTLLTKLLSIWGAVVESLLREGKWTVLEHVVSLLHESDAVRPDLTEEHQQQLASILNGLGRTERIKTIESYLNRSPDANVEGLSTILLLMTPDAVPGLCTLLANLTSPAHQAIVVEVLTLLAKDKPDAVVRGLMDRRPAYVRNLLSILLKWNTPRFVESIEKLIRYPDAQVRRDVVRAIGQLRPNGSGVKLVPLTSDTDESVRFAALKLLISGQYTVPFTQWSPLVLEDGFMDRPISERRAVFQAMRMSCGDEAVPYWQELMTTWTWTNRRKREELAVLAAETLGKLATPVAISALERGSKKGNAAVRQACSVALTQALKRQQQQPSATKATDGETA